jgi:hypothetical protein
MERVIRPRPIHHAADIEHEDAHVARLARRGGIATAAELEHLANPEQSMYIRFKLDGAPMGRTGWRNQG